MALSIAIPTASASTTENFEFIVPAENGLKLFISGYNMAGKQIFGEYVSKREMRDGQGYYVVRIDENIIFAKGIGMWCVQDMRSKWSFPAEVGKTAGEPVCDRKPIDNKGSYLFKGK